MSWYLKNKKREQEKQKNYKSTTRFKALRKEYDRKNHEHQLELKKKWRVNNPEKYKAERKKSGQKYYAKNKADPIFLGKKHISGKKYYVKNKDKIKEYYKQHSQLPEIKKRRAELTRLRRRSNPQSNRSGTIDLQIAMNNVRKRDHNTCQWQGCGLNFRQSPIHVHHIFPRSEYPEFELIEQYMICYCANHHGLWHRFRGDKYSEMIPARYQENGILSDEVKY